MAILNKNLFLTTLTCPTAGWLLRNTPSPKVSRYDHFLMEQGIEVHKKAHALYPTGILVEGNETTAHNKTNQLLKDPHTTVLFEPVFHIHEGIAKADILKREKTGWRIYEIKSSLNEKNEFLDDLAYTTMVALQSGLPVSGCSLLLLSGDYRPGLPVTSLFIEIDHTEEALGKAKGFWKEYDRVLQTVQSTSQPVPELKWECRECSFYGNCIGKGLKNSIFTLPRLSHTKFCQLKDLNIRSIGDIPKDFPLTPTQEMVRKALQERTAFIHKDPLGNRLEGMTYPLYFLDFETVSTALPLYPDTAPYVRIPFQYSLHVCSKTGEILAHHEYLADPKRDCRKELAEHLIRHSDSQGSIICYGDFERGVISDLGKRVPGLKDKLDTVLNRLVDLCAILKDSYYHPDFQSSYSLKDVLPVVVPELSYEDMEIGNGGDAMAVFASMAMGKFDRKQEKEFREHLLSYCKLDTLAMVRLWDWLKGMVEEV